ncbi:modifier of mdg4 [Drosophila nasuta]|uniref:modifier of mdg4 n=1 Tax=Drosophila nasuta TaxID=42062 RepID=UPI00295E8655|nr:modifier of mdg4 [Drosophila nasuta]
MWQHATIVHRWQLCGPHKYTHNLTCCISISNFFLLLFNLNAAAKATTATSTLQVQLIPPRKRGRPKTKIDDPSPKLKLLDKLKAATKNESASKPAVYASTTKGGVKLVYEGHLFKFSFRKSQFSVFQCCFREHGEECKVRVVCDQKNVFPFDGEHVHFMQASDKSVTSSQFTPADGAISVVTTPAPKEEPKVEILVQNPSADIDVELVPEEEEESEVFEIHEIEESVAMETSAAAEEEGDQNETPPAPTAGEMDPNDFREKIKRRLQKALQNKKK